MRVLVTGANGFVGRALVEVLTQHPRLSPVAASRRSLQIGSVATVAAPGLDGAADWSAALAGIERVVHCAARAHLTIDVSAEPLAEYRRVNVEGTMALARQAAELGVRRFVFISSVKVNGEATLPGRPFSEPDPPDPTDAYGVSKLEAEQELWQLAADTGMEVVVLRPPLIYGRGAKGNLRRLMGLIASEVPLPFGSIRNSRSLIGLGNFVSAIVLALDHPAAAGRCYLVSDQRDVSTPELIGMMAEAMGRPARLWPVPVGLLRGLGRLGGRAYEVERLVGSLSVDSGRISRELGWRPLTDPRDELRAMADRFVN